LVAGRRACEFLGGVSRKAKLAILIVNHFIARKPTSKELAQPNYGVH